MQLQMRKLNEKTLLKIGFGWPGKKKNGHGHFNEKISSLIIYCM